MGGNPSFSETFHFYSKNLILHRYGNVMLLLPFHCCIFLCLYMFVNYMLFVYLFVLYEGGLFNIVIGVLQGTLLIPFTFRLLQPFEVFSLDGNTFFKSQNPFCKGREVGIFRCTLKTLVNCTTKSISGFITTTRKGFL